MEFIASIYSVINTASFKMWVFVVLLFVFSIALVIIVLWLPIRSYNRRKENKELRKRREVLKTRLNELTGKTSDKK